MSTRIKRLVASTGAAMVLAAGIAVVAAPAASAAPCGLSGSGNGDRYYYTIRNCHGYTVKREVDIANGEDDGTCHTIRAYSEVSDFVYLAPWEHVRGIKPC